MTEKVMWKLYVEKNNVKGQKYDAWCYGSSVPNELARLTAVGIKTATASAYKAYEIENSPLPPEDGLNMILDTNNNAVCITRTSKVYVCPFSEVSERHAYKEGEGDRSLAYWRKVHKEVFSKELQEYGLEFDESMLVVCEEFEVVFKA